MVVYSRRRFIKTGIVAALAAIPFDALWFEKFMVETKEFYLRSSTEETDNIRIMQVSDLHMHAMHWSIARLAEKINALHPDLILFTGDIIDQQKNTSILPDFLKLIALDIPKVAILGNWEHWGNVDLVELDTIYHAYNCQLLINQTRQFSLRSKTIAITGLDDLLGGRPDFEAAIKEYKPSDYHIILHHCPEQSEYLPQDIEKDFKVDFMLSGHTHGGQINLFGFVPHLPPGCGRYIKGWYKDRSPLLYVSKGIGTSIYPVRFGSRAEIALFNVPA
jgi:predicted MPP superfamily phosphohydrolase